ncbi:MAG: phosphatidylglycerophosphatase A [Phycisphaerales bacterium]|nr:phosphatidylglycerophosphatase A [Phycisphaerales bacterium]
MSGSPSHPPEAIGEPPPRPARALLPGDLRLATLPRFERFVLTAGGLGLLRPAPGTWGSLPPVLLTVAMVGFLGPHWTVNASLVVLAVAASVGCVRFGANAERASGRKDASAVVIDEVAGQAVALLALPWRVPASPADWRWNLVWALVAFLAFRAMDILKPPPAHQVQRLKGGLGILMDDLIAGLYALALTQIVARMVLPGVM